MLETDRMGADHRLSSDDPTYLPEQVIGNDEEFIVLAENERGDVWVGQDSGIEKGTAEHSCLRGDGIQRVLFVDENIRCFLHTFIFDFVVGNREATRQGMNNG